MIITCPRCFATYRAPDRALPPSGRKVRCSSCHFDWVETPLPQEAIAGLAPNRAEPPVMRKQVEPDPLPREIPRPRPAPPKPKPKSKLLPALGWAALVVLSVVVLAYVLRAPLGHRSPALADFYEDMGLPVESVNDWFKIDVTYDKEERDGQTVLALTGHVTNISRRDRVVPDIPFYWHGNDGKTGAATLIKVEGEPLKPGESRGFHGELVGVDARASGEIRSGYPPVGSAPAPAHVEEPAPTEGHH